MNFCNPFAGVVSARAYKISESSLLVVFIEGFVSFLVSFASQRTRRRSAAAPRRRRASPHRAVAEAPRSAPPSRSTFAKRAAPLPALARRPSGGGRFRRGADRRPNRARSSPSSVFAEHQRVARSFLGLNVETMYHELLTLVTG